MMDVFVLSCLFDGSYQILGVYPSLLDAIIAFADYVEKEEIVEDVGVDNIGRNYIIYSNMATYTISHHKVDNMRDN